MTVDKNGNLGGQQPPWEPEVTPEVTLAESDDDGALGSPWNRRTFLKAAALGTAAAALWQKGPGLRLGPAAAYADDLSSLNCTANDVRIVGPGIILNEPCACTGSFTAQVQFHIINNTGTDRYCVTAHLCAGRNAAGQVVVPAQDVVVGNIPANFDGLKTVTIPNYPCNSGLVCFGAAGSAEDGGFAKGEACPAGQCCSTITWNVKASDPCPDTTRQISSKCRHQQICIRGRGVTLDCNTGTSGVQTNCEVACGGTTSLELCVSGGTPGYVFRLFAADGTTELAKYPASGTTTDTCHTFTNVGPINSNTTIIGKVTDADNCTKQASVSLTVSAITTAITVAGGSNGVLTFSASAPTGQSGCTRSWTIDGTAAANVDDGTKKVVVNADGTLTYRNLDGVCHTIGVTTNCSGCQGTDSKKVSQCVTTTQNCT